MDETKENTRVFISYAWDEKDEGYRTWVIGLAARLREDSVRARLDAWHLEGRNITSFMNSEIRLADKVLVLCTPELRRKVHLTEDGAKQTGAGWEVGQLGSLLFQGEHENKAVVALARGAWNDAAPNWLLDRDYVDLSAPAEFEEKYLEVLRKLTDTARRAPPLGQPRSDLQQTPVRALRGTDTSLSEEREGKLVWKSVTPRQAGRPTSPPAGKTPLPPDEGSRFESWQTKLVAFASKPFVAWTAVITALAVLGLWVRHEVGVLDRIEESAEESARSYLRHLASQDAEALSEMVEMPFFFGEQRFTSPSLLQDYFSSMFEKSNAEPNAEDQRSNIAMYNGALFGRWLIQASAVPNFDVIDSAMIEVIPDLSASPEADDPTGPAPMLGLGEDAARADIRLKGFMAEDVEVMHLYFSVRDEVAQLIGVLLR